LNLPVLSLVALLIAILISCISRINVGFLSIAFALVIGVFFGGMKVSAVIGGFPASLFVTLVGITLLFSQARVNGTLDKVANLSVKLARNRPGMIPIIFFALALILATIGVGNIAAAALLIPVALAIGEKAGVAAFLMAIMVGNGANAGAFSPFAPTGIIANELMTKIGLTAFEWQNYLNTLVAQSFVAFAGYFTLGGLKLLARADDNVAICFKEKVEPFTGKQKLTLGVIAALVASVVLLKVDVTLGAFVGAVLLSLFGAADEEEAVKAIPWGTILMVSGVTVLIALMEKTGGMELFTTILAKFSTRTSVTATIAFVTGVISVYSSSSGVVLPAFLPTIPGLITKLGGGDALAIASSINVGAHLVDISPLSTLGALCLANAPVSEDRRALFNKLLVWGLSMCIVGAVVCFVFFGLLF
jgi:di/tricarboxylate transporter